MSKEQLREWGSWIRVRKQDSHDRWGQKISCYKGMDCKKQESKQEDQLREVLMAWCRMIKVGRS